jgi:hypothetical protein
MATVTPKQCKDDMLWLFNNGAFDNGGFKKLSPSGANHFSWVLEQLGMRGSFHNKGTWHDFAVRMHEMRENYIIPEGREPYPATDPESFTFNIRISVTKEKI